ncbi:hypothetical protein [Roseovarius sp.]|uniref:hypothetical protein n=1 Tax=Roseovarius sp. TaxID=1486281 RepID=UPI003A977FAC
MARIVNGRLVDVPDGGMYGDDLIDSLNPGKGRRIVMGSGIKVETVKRGEKYSADRLRGRGGKPIMVKEMPDRTKG